MLQNIDRSVTHRLFERDEDCCNMFSVQWKLTGWLSWPLIRAHLCTLAISVSFNATWRVPRDGFRYGGLAYGLLLTVALIVVALPVTLLQLAIGQLSQQDAVGVWRAVPFFRGVGYIRLLVSFLGSAYSVIYLSLSIAYFLYTATHAIPFDDCIEWIVIEEENVNVVNGSECLSNTFMSPVSESPEYYLAIGLINAVLWIASPFVFYSSVKLMKRMMYLLAPLIIILGIVVVSCIGDSSGLASLGDTEFWQVFKEPYIWISAVVQAFWSCQIAGGYLIAAGDSVYASTNVQWTSVVMTCTNIVSSWFWLLFWYGVSGTRAKDTSVAAVLVQMYQVADDEQLSLAWPLLVYLTLILSGVITSLVLLYPIYDRLRRVGGIKWRLASFAFSVFGAGVSLAILAGRLPLLSLVEDLAEPLLVCMATLLEILAFGFIYGWRNLVEDVEFLISDDLVKYWVWGWWLAAAVIAPFSAWWLVVLFIGHTWTNFQEATTVLATVIVASVIFVLCAAIAVGRQVQYDIFGKLKSSFEPARHWGPRDPITHYYWLARRENVNRGNAPRMRYNHRELGQLSSRPSFLTVTNSIPSKIDQFTANVKNRSNSDDWLYTLGRKAHITELYQNVNEKKRSKSVDWDVPIRKSLELSWPNQESVVSSENNNNIVGFQYNDNVEIK